MQTLAEYCLRGRYSFRELTASTKLRWYRRRPWFAGIVRLAHARRAAASLSVDPASASQLTAPCEVVGSDEELPVGKKARGSPRGVDAAGGQAPAAVYAPTDADVALLLTDYRIVRSGPSPSAAGTGRMHVTSVVAGIASAFLSHCCTDSLCPDGAPFEHQIL